MEKIESSFFFFDIETICDTQVFKDDSRQSQQGQKTFPPLYAHKIVTIGAMLLDQQFLFKKIGILGDGKEEDSILREFNKFVSDKKPIMVSFNGRRFDLPVIMLRSLKYGIDMRWYLTYQDYTKRYPDSTKGFPSLKHYDLCDILSMQSSAPFPSLDGVSMLLGLGGKRGMDGSKVQEEYEKGNLTAIQGYCLADVVMTACVFLRYMLISGGINPERYNDSLDSCIKGISQDERIKGFISLEEIESLKITL